MSRKSARRRLQRIRRAEMTVEHHSWKYLRDGKYPPRPTPVGTIWFDTSCGVEKQWNGAKWVPTMRGKP